MTYFVHVDCVPPSGTPPFDALQRAGVASLFGRALDGLEGADDPHGETVELDDRYVASHPDGAKLLLEVDAPDLETAEAAAGAMVEAVLEAVEEFEDWSIISCGVELHDGLAKEALAAADGPDAPPSDVAERARKLSADVPSVSSAPEPDPQEAERHEAKLRALAGGLAYGWEAFGCGDSGRDVSREDAELAAGALAYAVDLLTDELFADLVELEGERQAKNVAESDAVFFVLELLPPAFAAQYTPLFVRKFILAAAGMVTGLTSPGWSGPASTAEELALRLLIDEAIPALEMHDLYDDAVAEAFEAFKDTVFGDDDHEWLYDEDPFDEQDDVAAWFEPLQPTARVHPYTVERGSRA